MNIKSIIFEWLMTLSSKDSLFSSKRIERFAAFTLGVGMIIVYFAVKVFCLVDCEMTSTDVILLSGTLLAYGGYNMHKTEKSKSKKHDEAN